MLYFLANKIQASVIMQLTIDQTRKILQNFLHSNRLESSILTITPGCEKSDGYVSYVYKITIIETSNQREKNLIIKCAPNQEQFRSLMSIRQLYLSEIYFYETILPELNALQANFQSVPKFIAAIKTPFEEVLVLEDVRSMGYSMRDKQLAMDEPHIGFILKEYGKFHALSFGLKHRNVNGYKKMVQGLKDIHGGRNCLLNDCFYNWYRPSLVQTVEMFNLNTEVCRKLKHLQENLESVFENIFEYDGKNGVFAHMDCWSNNMLFQYHDKETEPTSMYLLDFQYIYNTSPVIDIAYFFYVSAWKTEYCKLDKYLKIYYKSLHDSSYALGVDLFDIYPYSEFKNEWLRFARYGFLRGIFGIPLSLRHQQDIVDVKDIVDKGMESDKAFGVDDWSDACSDWIRELTLHMCDNNFI